MVVTVYAARAIHALVPGGRDGTPAATHVAVGDDGRIVALGTLDSMRAAGALPARFELDEDSFAGAVLLPGFVEGHCHLKEGGLWAWPYLGAFERTDPAGRRWPGLRSMAAVIARLAEVDAAMRREGRPETEPIVAWGFDPIHLAGGARMTVRDLEAASATATRPIVVAHANGHLMNVNAAMLRIAGIDAATAVEGVTRFAGSDEPTGELAEPAAMHLVLRHVGQAGLIAPMDDAGMHGFAAIAVRGGVTTATDLVNKLGEADVALLRRHAASEAFPLRLLPAFQAFHGTHRAADGAAHVRELMRGNTDKLRFGLVKMMLDGSIQGFSARLRAPGYHNGARNGIWVTAPAQYEADLETYHRAGLPVHTHTNGDEASEVAVAAFERVLAKAPGAHRHVLQHAQMVDRPLFARMARLGLAVNLFANHLWYWGDAHHDLTMGPERAMGLDDARAALDAGVRVAIHSDAPVTPLAPLFTAWCAANRLTPTGRVLGPERRLSVREALEAITSGPAWTLGLEREIGTLEPGRRAEFAVLEDDPFELGAARLKDVRVRGTFTGGRLRRAGVAAHSAAGSARHGR